MRLSINFVVALLALSLLGGCATSRSILDVQVPVGQVGATTGKQVVVNLAKDKRQFQVNPSSQAIPSLDPSEDVSDAVKVRAVGRKRNAYGKALGDMLLKDGQSVETLVSQSIKQAFEESGYKVVSDKAQIDKDTYVVDADIEKFWTYFTPGFWSITLSSEIATELSIRAPDGSTKQSVFVKAEDGYQVATDGNWIQIINKALRLYVDELKKKLK